MLVKELGEGGIESLLKHNQWFEEKVNEMTQETIDFWALEEFNSIGCEVFDCHDSYGKIYLRCPRINGGKAPEKLAGKLDTDYLYGEDKKLYDELCELNAKMEDAEEWDEDRPEYERMTEIADTLAEHITEQLDSYNTMETWDATREQEIESIANGDRWLSDLEVVDGKIKEVLWH